MQRVRSVVRGVKHFSGGNAEDQRGGDGKQEGSADSDADMGCGTRIIALVVGRTLHCNQREAQIVRCGQS